MSDLYLKNVGRAAKLKERLQKLETAIRAALETLQTKADPLEDVASLDGEVIAAEGVRVGGLLVEWQAARDELKAVNKALGR